jgi:hypothetical protein
MPGVSDEDKFTEVATVELHIARGTSQRIRGAWREPEGGSGPHPWLTVARRMLDI